MLCCFHSDVFMKRIWVSLSDDGYVKLGTGRKLHENVVLNELPRDWSSGDYLESLSMTSSSGGDNFDVTVYSKAGNPRNVYVTSNNETISCIFKSIAYLV